MNEIAIIQVLLYSGILVYLGYTLGRRDHKVIIKETIEGLARTGFLKWYWKDGDKEFLKWRDPYPENMSEEIAEDLHEVMKSEKQEELDD